MTTLALGAATVTLGSVYTSTHVGAGTGLALPATETSIGANSGFSFYNLGSTLLRIVYGTVVGTITFQPSLLEEGELTTPITPNSAISTAYIYGPFDTNEWNDNNDLVQCLWSGYTGGSVGIYLLPPNRYGS